MRWIGVVDCNNFFVSCERLFRPDLQTTPTVVLSSNDGCIVARSPEVKAMGVPMGVPYFSVKKELAAAGTVVFSANGDLYRDISKRVMAVLQELMQPVEQYSIDEAFFYIAGEETSLLQRAVAIGQTVQQQVGVPVSIGVARSKTIAKYASICAKQRKGACCLFGESWRTTTETLSTSEVWGVGRNMTQKMRGHGITTVAELLAVDRPVVSRLFGVAGTRVYDELSETAVYTVTSQRTSPQSIMSSRSFAAASQSLSVVTDAVYYHVAKVAAELRRKQVLASKLRVTLATDRHRDWALRGGSAVAELPHPTNDTQLLLQFATTLVRQLHEHGVPYRKAGATAFDITPTEIHQSALFSSVANATARSSVIDPMIDSLNAKFGKSLLSYGRVPMKKTPWQAKRRSLSPAYTTRWSDLPSVTA